MEETSLSAQHVGSHLDWCLLGIRALLSGLIGDQCAEIRETIDKMSDFLTCAARANADAMTSSAYISAMLVWKRRGALLPFIPDWAPDVIKRVTKHAPLTFHHLFADQLDPLTDKMTAARLLVSTSHPAGKRSSSASGSVQPKRRRVNQQVASDDRWDSRNVGSRDESFITGN